MSTRGKSSHALIDDFVRYLNGAGFEPKPEHDVPEELRTSEAKCDLWNWKIQDATSNPWIEELSQKLPQKWPDLYRSLIERHRFCEFEVGPVMFFANTGLALHYELSNRILGDKGIFPFCTTTATCNSGFRTLQSTIRFASLCVAATAGTRRSYNWIMKKS